MADNRTTRLSYAWLVAALLTLFVLWLVSATMLGIGCENREDEAVCESFGGRGSVAVAVVLEALLLGAFAFSRQRGTRTAFALTSASILTAAAVADVLLLLWGSGDL